MISTSGGQRRIGLFCPLHGMGSHFLEASNAFVTRHALARGAISPWTPPAQSGEARRMA